MNLTFNKFFNLNDLGTQNHYDESQGGIGDYVIKFLNPDFEDLVK
jgi:hypothetical protein